MENQKHQSGMANTHFTGGLARIQTVLAAGTSELDDGGHFGGGT